MMVLALEPPIGPMNDGTPHPRFLVNVAAKGLRLSVSLLESTLMDTT
jgi:hypothetical protein